ncbi:MAG: hypothetical protein NC036_05700 [Muribaculaceae bacterium]|nr:hypothetical protein [Muribaculaceae bacterium]
MKKLFTASLAMLAMLSVSAGTKTIYENGKLTAGVDIYGWWNVSMSNVDNPDGSATKVYKVGPGANGEDFSMGFNCNGNDWACGILNTATLNFKSYAEEAGSYIVRLTAANGLEGNYTINVAADQVGKWQNIAISVPANYPEIAQAWKEFKGNAGNGYVFSIIGKLPAGKAIYVNDIIYTDTDDSWKAPEVVVYPAPTTVPVPTQAADDVLSIFSGKYTAATTFGIGGWGQTTKVETLTIDGAPVEYLKNFNYLGWEFAQSINVSDYQKLHVDYFTPNGEAFGFTPIFRNSSEKIWKASEVKQNEWNSYDVDLTYFDGANLANAFQMKFDFGGGSYGYIANVYFYKESGETPNPNPGPNPGPEPGEGEYTGTLSSSVVQNDTDFPYTLGYSIVYNTDKTLTVTARYTWADNAPFGVVPGEFFINGKMTSFSYDESRAVIEKVRVGTTAETFNPGEEVTINFHVAAGDGAVLSDNVAYKVGETNSSVAVEVIEDVNAPVEFYNLQGIRVVNPENGLYIRRQGNKVTKVIL